jgi:hypothetical protein
MEFKEALVKSLPAVERIAEWGFKDRSRYEWKREPPVGEIERILSDWREKLQAFQHVRGRAGTKETGSFCGAGVDAENVHRSISRSRGQGKGLVYV